MLFPILLSLVLVALARGQIEEVASPGFFDCGKFQCVNETGVTCDAPVNKCNCPRPDDHGDGRIACAAPDRNCLCVLHGDPHLNTFAGRKTSMSLPCAHTLADLTTKTNKFADGCKVNIIGKALYGDRTHNPFISLERQIDLRIEAGNTEFYARIIKGETPLKTIDTEGAVPSFHVKIAEEDGFICVSIPDCNVEIKYKEDRGFFSVRTPIENITNPGLCGDCSRTFAGSNHPNPFGARTWLGILLDSLVTSSPYDGSDINTYPYCTDLTNSVRDCPIDRREYAINFCGDILNRKSVWRCLIDNGYKAVDIEGIFAKCYDDVCTEVDQSCAHYVSLFQGCEPNNMEELSDMQFCYIAPP